MNDYVSKNYFTDGGDTLVIGGKLVVEEDAEIDGLETGGGDLPVATKHDLGAVRIGTGLDITTSGTLSVSHATSSLYGGIKQLPYQANTTATSVEDLVTAFNQLLGALRAADVMANS